MAMKRIALLCACLLSACSLFAGEDVSEKDFSSPDRHYYPQTWFHFIDGNVDKEGISRDLEAIASAGISGIHFFHGGQFGGDWPGVRQHIECLSPLWNDALEHTASEAKRLGLSFTMQNCPGWSMSGGPWITPGRRPTHAPVDTLPTFMSTFAALPRVLSARRIVASVGANWSTTTRLQSVRFSRSSSIAVPCAHASIRLMFLIFA